MAAFDGGEAGGVLLYVGALYDAYPICLPSVRRAHSVIVYTDALPANQYYTSASMQSEESILCVLREEGGHYAMATSEFTRNESDGSFECMLQDGCTFKYFFNASNIDESRIPPSLLQRVTTLWLHGHTFPASELSKLPSLRMVHAPPSIIDADPEAYWAARRILGTVEPEAVLMEYNARCLIPDVIYYTQESGFMLRGESALLPLLPPCDAPFTFEEGEEGDEDEEGGGEEDGEEEEEEEEGMEGLDAGNGER